MKEQIEALQNKPNILVVDDREAERDILKKWLSKFHAEIHTAESGQEALSLLIRHSYTLVLLDINMPIMDGLETAKLMRSNPMTENTPIIFLTAYDKDEIDMMQGYKVGAIDYLLKPINKEILLSKVDMFLRSYRFEKEKEYEKILTELEKKNQKLLKAQEQAVFQMKEANKARKLAEKSQKKIEKQAEDLLRYNKELEQFAYVATHDLRAPIINLNGLLKIFEKRGFINDKNKVLVDKMFKSIRRINATIQDLIQVVAYRKTAEEDVQKINLDPFIQDIISDLEEQINHAGAEVKVNIDEAPEVHYVPSHLRSILQNLISNAIKYRSPKRTPKIEVKSSHNKEMIDIAVSDNGMGIEPRNNNKVFGLFQRLTTHVDGKGMGLYITKSQLEAMGGRIDFESAPDKGSTFRASLVDLKDKVNG